MGWKWLGFGSVLKEVVRFWVGGEDTWRGFPDRPNGEREGMSQGRCHDFGQRMELPSLEVGILCWEGFAEGIRSSAWCTWCSGTPQLLGVGEKRRKS